MTPSAPQSAPAAGTLRWPLHPPPGRLESLSSWLDRIAVLYKLTTEQLVGPRNLMLAQPYPAYQLDVDPPPAVLAALTERTGVPVDRLQAMTLAGWVPWLTDELPPLNARHVVQTFSNYVRANPVLFPVGEAGVQDPDGHLRNWAGPWQPPKPLVRHCPVCLTEPGRGRDLMWRLPLVLGCGVHGCYLEDLYTATFHTLLNEGRPMPPRPVPEPLATLEGYTYSALRTGRVVLPGRTVPAAVWFRLLRSLLDEVSLAITSRHTRPRTTLRKIWATTGLPLRGGLNVWTPTVWRPSSLSTNVSRRRSVEQPGVRRFSYIAGSRPSPRRCLWQPSLARAPTASWSTATAHDLVLRLPGQAEDLDPGTHIGTLAPHGGELALDLLPSARFAG